MIVSALACILVAAPSVPADTDFTLVWSSGEISRDASHSTSTWKLEGTTLTHDGEESGHVMRHPDTHKTTTVSADDLKKLAEGLAHVDAAAKKLKKEKHAEHQGRFTSVKYVHGKQAFELFFPYWTNDEEHRPKNEKKEKLDAMDAIDELQGKLFGIEGPG